MSPPPTLQDLIETVRRDAGTDQSIDLLVAAATTAAQLEETTDDLLGYFVDRCRRDGRSWSEISAALGVTKQAVHKRFASAVAAHIIAATPTPTFERFTNRARHVVAESRQAALALGSQTVGSDHILLGLFAEPDGLAGRALSAMGVSEDAVRAVIVAASADGSSSSSAADAAAGAQPEFADEGKRALSDALTVALEFEHNYIGTEHLLLGLYRNGESQAATILTDAGAFEATARALVTEYLRGFGQTA
jgi:ATP-dependent Clp protease ATP-binding subunit ClpA